MTVNSFGLSIPPFSRKPKIDFYDPFPETSGGLVRPFELVSFSPNPIDWFELTATISAYFSLSIEIGEDYTSCFIRDEWPRYAPTNGG